MPVVYLGLLSFHRPGRGNPKAGTQPLRGVQSSSWGRGGLDERGWAGKCCRVKLYRKGPSRPAGGGGGAQPQPMSGGTTGVRCRRPGLETSLGRGSEATLSPEAPKARPSPASHALRENSLVSLVMVTGGTRAQRQGREGTSSKPQGAPLCRRTSRWTATQRGSPGGDAGFRAPGGHAATTELRLLPRWIWAARCVCLSAGFTG